jgi:hypothetical protein
MFKTLDELKAENAAEAEQPVAVDEQLEVEQPEMQAEASEPEAKHPDEGQAESDAEEWLQESSDKAVPLAKHVAVKHKLRGQIEEKDSVIEQMKAEIEALKQHKPAATQSNELPKPPKLSDFDFDEDRHAEAMLDYTDKLLEHKLSKTLGSQQQQQEQERQAQRLTEQVESHYERAAKLVEAGVITVEKYQAADRRVRQELDSVTGAGDLVADNIIARLGDGSEKVIAHLGVNQAAMQALKMKLTEDPTGLSAAVYLGQLNAKFSAPANKLSKAPNPDSGLRGDKGGVTTTSSDMLKKYQSAHKSGDIAKAVELKLKAKASGINTSNW